eukprot:TRINITY_DN28305_c0_g1_i1.p1 TRINITY_DN28305_c0_g1~~TRINITY_DN28305_c0_g1_i1.p1  ORF type:complete len:493 (+),score=113.43 TRINITY_DN28305_c0_g1_i1:66-1481(+)
MAAAHRREGRAYSYTTVRGVRREPVIDHFCPVRSCSVGEEHTVLVTQRREVVSVTDHDWVGLPDNMEDWDGTLVHADRVLLAEAAVAGEGIHAVLGAAGEVSTLGHPWDEGRKELPPAALLAASPYSFIVITAADEAYGFGPGQIFSALGLGSWNDDHYGCGAVSIPALSGLGVRRLACGAHLVVAEIEEGGLLFWECHPRDVVAEESEEEEEDYEHLEDWGEAEEHELEAPVPAVEAVATEALARAEQAPAPAEHDVLEKQAEASFEGPCFRMLPAGRGRRGVQWPLRSLVCSEGGLIALADAVGRVFIDSGYRCFAGPRLPAGVRAVRLAVAGEWSLRHREVIALTDDGDLWSIGKYSCHNISAIHPQLPRGLIPHGGVSAPHVLLLPNHCGEPWQVRLFALIAARHGLPSDPVRDVLVHLVVHEAYITGGTRADPFGRPTPDIRKIRAVLGPRAAVAAALAAAICLIE